MVVDLFVPDLLVMDQFVLFAVDQEWWTSTRSTTTRSTATWTRVVGQVAVDLVVLGLMVVDFQIYHYQAQQAHDSGSVRAKSLVQNHPHRPTTWMICRIW